MSARSISPLVTLGLPWLAAAALGIAAYVGTVAPGWGAAALVLALLGPLWTFRAHSPSIVAVFLAVLLGGVVTSNPLPRWRPATLDAAGASELLGRWSTSGRFNSALPIVLHLVFDELMSPGAMPDTAAGVDLLRREVRELAGRHSLRLFDSVYSRHFFSSDALPSMMAAEYRGAAAPSSEAGPASAAHGNEAFADLERRGYRTVVFQTSHIDFCGSAAVDMCETFASFDPAPAGGSDYGPSRAAPLWRTVARSLEPSFTSQLARLAIDRFAGGPAAEMDALGVADRYDVQGFPGWFDRFAAFAAGVPRGTHIYAHFMAPHGPYLLDERCEVQGDAGVGYYLGSRYPPAQRAAAQRDFYAHHIRQARCVVGKIDQLLARLRSVDAYRDAVVILHGDHGARISSGNVLEEMNERDFVDNYATLFAVRASGVAPGIDCGFRSLGEAFRQALGSRDGAPDAAEPVPVSVISRAAGGAKVPARMPIFGCAADGR